MIDKRTLAIELKLIECALGYAYQEETVDKNNNIKIINKLVKPSIKARNYWYKHRDIKKLNDSDELLIERRTEIQRLLGGVEKV